MDKVIAFVVWVFGFLCMYLVLLSYTDFDDDSALERVKKVGYITALSVIWFFVLGIRLVQRLMFNE